MTVPDPALPEVLAPGVFDWREDRTPSEVLASALGAVLGALLVVLAVALAGSLPGC